MRTFSPKPSDIQRAWHVVDADGLVLGRLATEVARVLRGKHKPIFAPHLDTGDHVIVVNAAKIVLTADKAGNWPMRFTVQGLPQLPRGGYYELYLTRHGRIAAACGTFNVHGGRTTVSLNAPYHLREYDGWVVTRHLPSRPQEASRPLLTT